MREIFDSAIKNTWRDTSRLEDVVAGLQAFEGWSGSWLVPEMTLAFPKLGCGLGSLSWDEVKPQMEHYLSRLVCQVVVYI